MKKLKGTFALVLALTMLLSTAAGFAEEAAKPVLLVVSFGTSYNDSREATIGAIEAALADAYPEYEVRRAFTAQIVIDILAERDGLAIDNVTEAMDRLVADGVKDVVLQPTHIMNGFEYEDVLAEVAPYAESFDSFKIGAPLLTSDADFDLVAAAITAGTVDHNAEDTAIAFMGHGTEHEANAVYAKLQTTLADAGYANYFIGTVEAEPSLDEVLASVQASGASKVVLLPLMVVAGDHATNDMAGDDEDTWKSVFEAAGFEVTCVLEGLGQNAAIRQIYIDHVADAIAQ
ncbi:MAG: sirohydrochlorin cobaltochelatase [Christensenellales bacterium]|jgi:sirohydrochlorin cobaltochelatase